MHSPGKLGVVVAVVVASVATLAGAGSAAPAKAAPPAASSKPAVDAPPASATGALSFAMTDGTLYPECDATTLRWRLCDPVTDIVAVTLVNGFVVVTRKNGARVVFPGQKVLALMDVATVAEKP